MQNQTVSGVDALSIDSDLVTGLLCGFVREEVGRVGFERVVLGLSGGVDSAVAAAIACRALGPERVVPVLMPYRTSAPASEADARAVCTALGMEPLRVEISPQVDAYFERFPDADRARRGNKMSRERMSILYDLSVEHRGLVVGTSNKTELLLGYGTLHGDLASALNPLGDLYKTQVFALARALALPDAVIDKPPSADLFEGQSDEADFGFRYAVVDTLLHFLVDQRRTLPELRELGFEHAFVEDIQQRIRRSQFKRRPPLIAKLGPRTIDREFRYARDWGS